MSGAKTLAQEFDLLDDEANIYKQIGPVLLKQDKTEALMSVNGRLEFIDKEIRRFETQIKTIQDKSEKLKVEVRHTCFCKTHVGLTNNTDYPDTERHTAATAGTSRSIESCHDQKQIRYPLRFDTLAEACTSHVRTCKNARGWKTNDGLNEAGVECRQSACHHTHCSCAALLAT